MNKLTTVGLSAALASVMLLSGCATGGSYVARDQYGNVPPPQQGGMNRTGKGSLIGAGIGIAAGLLSGGDATERRQRALVGAGVGALSGAAIGNYQDRQERALRQRTAGTGVDVVRSGDNITLNFPNNITFGFDSANLSPGLYPTLDGVADTLREYNQTVVEVAGHTDSVGSDDYNQKLSERRANAVGDYLMGKGLMRERFILVGAGETRPIASNDTETGRAQNRRVEITLVPMRN